MVCSLGIFLYLLYHIYIKMVYANKQGRMLPPGPTYLTAKPAVLILLLSIYLFRCSALILKLMEP